MALKKVELFQDTFATIQYLDKEIMELPNAEFTEKINELIVKGIKKIKFSDEASILLENISQLAKKTNKGEEVEQMLKTKLKEINKELVDSL